MFLKLVQVNLSIYITHYFSYEVGHDVGYDSGCSYGKEEDHYLEGHEEGFMKENKKNSMRGMMIVNGIINKA